MDARALTLPPAPLSRHERIAAWVLAVFAAVMRWPALSLTMWDWDEGLFILALRDYDVAAHHPHPPGFPLFIAAAKWIPTDPFHALQTVTFLSALFVFPAMFFLARELRASAPAAMGAGLLLAFFPNVWFYGGTALSDVPSMVLVVAAAALLLRGCRDDASLLAGAVLLGIAAGFRPQNLMIGLVPFAVAFRHRRRAGAVAALILATIVVATYAIAASLSGGWDVYREALARHQTYIRTVDSFLSPRHPGLWEVSDDFFFRPFRAPAINTVVIVLMAIGMVRRRPWLVIAIFGPFCLFAWLFLDFHSASRFSIAYMPLYAFLAAEGIPRRGRVLSLAALVALMIGWTWPALRIVHTTPSPPVAACNAIRALHGTETERATTVVYVDGSLAPHVEVLIPEYDRRLVRAQGPLVPDPDAVLVREGASTVPGAKNFTRERDCLAAIARRRYFEVSVLPRRRPTAGNQPAAASTSSPASRLSSEK